jgi:hypothetical protein
MKLLRYIIAFCILYFTCSVPLKAQIVYTDVNPDLTSTSFFNLDLNNDGITDFVLSHSGINGPCLCGGYTIDNIIRITLDSGNAVVYNGGPSAMVIGDTISSTLNFSTTVSQNLSYSTANCIQGCHTIPQGNWHGVSNHYLGLKLKVGNNYFYGLAKLDVNSTGSNFTIKEYAYNSSTNNSILAGQTCSPQADIKATGPLSFCSGGSVLLTSKNSGNTLKYQWKKNTINISGATNKNYTATAAGDYKVKVTDTLNNCFKTSGTKTVLIPCRDSNEKISKTLEQLSLYPNPFSQSTSIYFSLPRSQKVSLKIFDLNGRLTSTLADKTFEAGENKIAWNGDDVKAGIYFLQFQTNETIQTEKLIITK